jgi:U3 small nucleolar RNA-associated protein 21
MAAFSPFRLVGSIMGELPVSYTSLYEKPSVMVPLHRSFLLYGGIELHLLRGGPTFEEHVTAVAQSGKYRYAAEGGRIHAFVHHRPAWTAPHSKELMCRVTRLLAADELLFSVGEDRKIKVWHYRTGEVLHEILLPFNCGNVSAMVLPLGYINKLLVSTTEGILYLYNFRTAKLLYTFGADTPFPPITSLTVHPHYKDLVAFGCGDGTVIVHHISDDREITRFNHVSGAVTAVEFRQDVEGLLFSGTSTGEVALWDLKLKAMVGVLTRSKQVRSRDEVLDNVHSAAVHSIVSVPGMPMLVTCGADNAMCQFRLDTIDGMALLIRERRGHYGPCTAATFYNTDLLLSAGSDRSLRCTHVFSDRASWEMSQGKMGKRSRDEQVSRAALKLPPVSALACGTARNYQWASIATLHDSSAQIAAWRLDTRALETKTSPLKTGVHCCRSLALTLCGNYVVVGYSSGHLTRLNLQDQTYRHFLDRAGRPAHKASVESVAIGNMNSVVLSCGLDQRICLWDLLSGHLAGTIEVGFALTKNVVHPSSSLIGVACSDFGIRFFDWTAPEKDVAVRHLVGHRAAITAMALTPDTSRHLISASMDSAILVWDIAAAQCVGFYRMGSPAQTLGFHPDALFMVTTHPGERGVSLWTNNLRYGFAPDIVDPLAKPVQQAPLLHFPEQRPDDILGDDEIEAELFDVDKDTQLRRAAIERGELEELEAITCAGLRRSSRRFQELQAIGFLDQIKERNQPLLPPKKEKAPFFLETTRELNPTFIIKVKAGDGTGSQVQRGVLAGTCFFSPQTLLEDKEQSLAQLVKMTPQEIDLHLRQIIQFQDSEATAEEIREDQSRVLGTLQFLTWALQNQQNVDVIEHVLGHFLDLHSQQVISFGQAESQIRLSLEELLKEQSAVRSKITGLVDYPLCLVSAFSQSYA